MKFCSKCGKENVDNAVVCQGCGAQFDVTQNKTNGVKCVPAFVLGLIGAIFGLFGGMCVSACYSFGGAEGEPLFFMVGGSIIGLIGACMCFSKAKIGSLLEVVGAVMIGYCAFTITGSDIASLIGMLLLGVGGIVGLTMSKSSK